MPFPQKKEHAQQFLVAAYAEDYLTEVEFEHRVEALEAADTFDAVEALVDDLPRRLEPARLPSASQSSPVVPHDQQVMKGSNQVIRKRGIWLRSPRLAVSQKACVLSARFDQAGDPGFEHIEIDLDVSACTMRLLFPPGTRVAEDVDGTGSFISVAKRLRKTEDPSGPLVVLKGVANNSSIRVTRL